MLDLPHFIVKHFRKWFIYTGRKRKFFKDTWYFDLGYYQSQSSTIFFLAMIFSVLMPLASFFGFLFFFLKFYVEKYNMIFVYLKEFEARGRLKKYIIPMQLISLYIA